MLRLPPRPTRTATLFPTTPLCRSRGAREPRADGARVRRDRRGTGRWRGRRHLPGGAADDGRGNRGVQVGGGARPRTRRGRRAPGARGADGAARDVGEHVRSEEHTSELQSLMRISYAVFCLKKKKK